MPNQDTNQPVVMSSHRPSEDQRGTAVVEAIEVLNSLVDTEAQVGSQYQPVSQERTFLKKVVVVGVCILFGLSLTLELYRVLVTTEGSKSS